MPTMSKRFLLSIPVLAVFLALAALFLTRNDGSSGGTAEAAAQVRAAFGNIQTLDSYSVHQVSVAKSGGQTLTQEMTATYQLPDKAYARATATPGTAAEFVIDGRDVAFLKQAGGVWQRRSLQSLGINPDSFYKTDAEAFIPKELEVLGEITENGRVLIHYRAKLDGKKLVELLADVFTAESPMQEVLKDSKFEKLEAHYYVGKDDQLPYRGTAHFIATFQGTKADVTTEFEYFDINEPLVFPSDLPR
jgi:outer membrane lipoprotein-sorting protein